MKHETWNMKHETWKFVYWIADYVFFHCRDKACLVSTNSISTTCYILLYGCMLQEETVCFGGICFGEGTDLWCRRDRACPVSTQPIYVYKKIFCYSINFMWKNPGNHANLVKIAVQKLMALHIAYLRHAAHGGDI